MDRDYAYRRDCSCRHFQIEGKGFPISARLRLGLHCYRGQELWGNRFGRLCSFYLSGHHLGRRHHSMAEKIKKNSVQDMDAAMER